MEFESSIIDVDTVTKSVKVSIPAELFQKEFDSALHTVAQSANLKGFRAGKAPKDLVKKTYGDRVRGDVVERLISQSLQKIVKDSSLAVVGFPKIEVTGAEIGKAFEFTAELAIFPEPTIEHYQGVSVKVTDRTVSDDDVNRVVNEILKQQSEIREKSDKKTLDASDVAIVKIAVGTGDKLSTPEDAKIVLGEDVLPPEVETQLVGMSVGETRTVSGPPPAAMRRGTNVGEMTYKVELSAVGERVIPELTDDFIAKIDPEVKTALEFRLKVRKSLEEEAKRQGDSEIETAVVEEIVKKNEFAVPAAMIDEEMREMLSRFMRGQGQKEIDPRQINVDPFRTELEPIALRRVRGAIALERIAEQEKVTVSEADMKEWAESVADDERGMTVEKILEMVKSQNGEAGIERQLKQKKTLELIRSAAKVTYVPAEELKTEAAPE